MFAASSVTSSKVIFPSKIWSRAHRKTSPPELTGPPTTQCSLSKAYVKVRPFSSVFGLSVTTRMAPDVPIVMAATPGLMALTPKFDKGPSAAPQINLVLL